MSDPLSFETYLKQHDTLTYTNVGVSMLPLLRQGKDLFTVHRKGPERCKVGDVVLYRHGNDYVLHRVIEARLQDYVILGDNCLTKEYGVTDTDIIGIMTSYVRGGKEYSVNSSGYRCYSFLMLHSIPLRIAMKKGIIKIKRWIKKR